MYIYEIYMNVWQILMDDFACNGSHKERMFSCEAVKSTVFLWESAHQFWASIFFTVYE